VRQIDESLIGYLKQMAGFMPKRSGWKYSGFEDFYLKRGHLFPHAPYTDAEARAIPRKLAGQGDIPKQKECFLNAQRLAAHGDFGYAEGYVLVEGMPLAIHHAWAVLKGKPVDITLRDGALDTRDPVKLLERASRNLSRAAYYGVAFRRASFLRVWYTEKMARAVVDDYKRGFPLLRGER
jgi:hypothetical protein